MKELTCLTTADVPKRFAIRLLFGSALEIREHGDGFQNLWFGPQQIFAVVWWARISPRKQWACFAVVESLSTLCVGYHLPCITPAVRVHMWLGCRCRGSDRGVVAQAEAMIRGIETQQIDPADVPAAYYRAAGQSLRVGRQPRRLTREHFERFGRIQP